MRLTNTNHLICVLALDQLTILLADRNNHDQEKAWIHVFCTYTCSILHQPNTSSTRMTLMSPSHLLLSLIHTLHCAPATDNLATVRKQLTAQSQAHGFNPKSVSNLWEGKRDVANSCTPRDSREKVVSLTLPRLER